MDEIIMSGGGGGWWWGEEGAGFVITSKWGQRKTEGEYEELPAARRLH